ncbi:MAG: IS110 family transposase [Blastocatellia bacterium]
MDNIKYVGMDVHKAITVIVILNAAGQVESRTQVKTKAENLRDFFRGLSGTVLVVFEEGTQSAWLHQLLKPLVTAVTVCDARCIQRNNGHKSDDDDAEMLARSLRLGELKEVYKGDAAQRQLKELCRTYENLVEDTTRTKNRLKAIYRARAIACPGQELYRPDRRDEYLAKLTEEATRFRAETLLDQLAALRQLRKQAKHRFITQARAHADYARLTALPGFGAVRVGQLLATVGTPQRFRTKRQFWPYCGLAVVTKSTADYREIEGKIVRSQKKVATRGLNRNHNPRLKQVFKGAALTALGNTEMRAYYDRLVAAGTRPELARVAVARKLAAVALTIWQRKEDYDPRKIAESR